MMSSVLGKTFEQTLSLLRGNTILHSETEICLKKLQECVFSPTIEDTKAQEQIKECVKFVKDWTQNLHLTLMEKREILLIIAHLSNMDKNVDSVHPFVIKCIEDAKTKFDKSLGYIVLTMLNDSSPSSAYLAVNTLLKDICVRDTSVTCTALTAATFLIDIDLIPVFLPSVEKQLKNANSHVRYKAMCLLHKMFQIAPEYLVSIKDRVLEALCDHDPRIMSCCLPILCDLLKSNTKFDQNKIPGKMIFILKQVEQGRLPIDMMYHGVSAPWVQIKLIQIIRTLAREHFSESDFFQLEDIFKNILSRFQPSNQVQYAIISECVLTIVSFHPRLEKLEGLALEIITKFLNSNDVNLVLTGVELLKSLTQISPGCSRQCAETLLSYLSHSNPALITLILQLIGDLTCSDNSESIVKLTLAKLEMVSNIAIKKDILLALISVLEKYPMDENWMLQNYMPLLAVLEGDLDLSVIKKLLRCLQSVKVETLRAEAKRLAGCIKCQYTPLQYCMVLEIIAFHNSKLTSEECEKVVKDVLKNCSMLKWEKSIKENILLISWNLVLMLTGKHRLTVSKSFSQSENSLPSFILQQKYEETRLLMENLALAEQIFPETFHEISTIDIDENLTFLDKFTAASENTLDPLINETTSVNTNSESIPLVTEKPKFKYKPYSKSRFDTRDDSEVTETRDKKKVFLDAKGSQNVKRAWDQKHYVLDKTSVEHEANEEPQEKED